MTSLTRKERKRSQLTRPQMRIAECNYSTKQRQCRKPLTWYSADALHSDLNLKSMRDAFSAGARSRRPTAVQLDTLSAAACATGASASGPAPDTLLLLDIRVGTFSR